MNRILLVRAPGGLAPVDQEGADVLARLKPGEHITAEIRRARNPRFHRKMMALLRFAFDTWEPGEVLYNGQQIEKNFTRFRGDIMILCGHYETAIDIEGHARFIPKSISFASMGDEEFGELYKIACDVILKRILTNYTRDDLDMVVQKAMAFT